MSKIRTKLVVFFMTSMSIQPLWLTHFIEILLVPKFQLTKFIVGVFSYKAHFRPQISSNVKGILNIIPRFNKIVISTTVTFDEDSTYSEFRKLPIEEVEEPEGTRVRGTKIVEAIPEVHEDHDMTEPQELVETLHEKNSHKRKPAWARELIQDA